MEWKDAIGEGYAEDMGLATLQCMCDTVCYTKHMSYVICHMSSHCILSVCLLQNIVTSSIRRPRDFSVMRGN